LVKLENEGLKVYPSKTLKLIQNKGIQNPFIQNIISQQPISNASKSKSLIVDILDSKLKCLSYGNVLNLATGNGVK
jgi:hypothetical protein